MLSDYCHFVGSPSPFLGCWGGAMGVSEWCLRCLGVFGVFGGCLRGSTSWDCPHPPLPSLLYLSIYMGMVGIWLCHIPTLYHYDRFPPVGIRLVGTCWVTFIIIMIRQSEYFLGQGRPQAALRHLDEALMQQPESTQVTSFPSYFIQAPRCHLSPATHVSHLMISLEGACDPQQLSAGIWFYLNLFYFIQAPMLWFYPRCLWPAASVNWHFILS